jgi:hypothetical protein
MEKKVEMKWRYDFDKEARWSKRILPRKYYCNTVMGEETFIICMMISSRLKKNFTE